ncbi:MAG TPA: GNAT family N-acetyltransferase [Polyangiaceae bacterium]|nr:GNAT family N-acetyltransferase [Polyangiaceae bacterium]
MSLLEVSRGRFVISTDPKRLDLEGIHATLSASYWAEGISRERVARAIEHSLCFGLYDLEKQIGFARVISDYATFGYLADVYVIAEYRGQGLGTWLIEVVRAHPRLTDLRRFMLATRDAHALYRRHEFAPLSRPERFMEIFREDAYRSVELPPFGVEATLSPPGVAPISEGTIISFQRPVEWTSPPESRPPSSESRPPSPEPGPASAAADRANSEGNSDDALPVRVRPLSVNEGPLLRELRLGALHDSPHTFGERLEDALNRPREEWDEQARTLTDPEGPRVFVAEVDQKPAGLVLAVEDPNDPQVCRVGGMWVNPTQRRRGAGSWMLDAVVNWARERKKQHLRLWVQEDSASARALYESFGFAYTGARKPFPREPLRRLLEMDLTVEPE